MAHKSKDMPKQRIPKDMQDSMTRGGKHKSRQQKVNRADKWSKGAKHKVTDTDKAPVEESKSRARSLSPDAARRLDPLHSETDRLQAMRDLPGPAQKSKAWSELRSRAERSRAGKYAPGKSEHRRKENKHKIDFDSDVELDEDLDDIKDEISADDDNHQLIESEVLGMLDTPSLNRMAQLAGIEKPHMQDLEKKEYLQQDPLKKLKTGLNETIEKAEKLIEDGPNKIDYFDFDNDYGAWIHGFNKCLSLFRDLK